MPLKRMRRPWISIVSPSMTEATPAIGAGLEPDQFGKLVGHVAVVNDELRHEACRCSHGHEDQPLRNARQFARTPQHDAGPLAPLRRPIVVSIFVQTPLPDERMRLFWLGVQKRLSRPKHSLLVRGILCTRSGSHFRDRQKVHVAHSVLPQSPRSTHTAQRPPAPCVWCRQVPIASTHLRRRETDRAFRRPFKHRAPISPAGQTMAATSGRRLPTVARGQSPSLLLSGGSSNDRYLTALPPTHSCNGVT